MLSPLIAQLPDNAFPRLTALLAGVAPGKPPITMHIGEPQHAVPAFVAPILAREAASFGKYPPITGTDALRTAIAGWLGRRYGVTADPATTILPLAGTREGLFLAAHVVTPQAKAAARPAILIPNPFYQCYAAAALAAGAEPVYVNATAATGFLPDIAGLDPALLDRTAAVYLCSPSNPEGAVADAAWWRTLFTLADRHQFTVLADECYAEIYDSTPPPGALEVSAAMGRGSERLLAFHSLSKRSSLAGLRSGFVTGDPTLIAAFAKLRNYVGPTVPLPVQAASAAAWDDEAHVTANRALYRAKFDAAAGILGHLNGFRRPEAGFFLWLAAPARDGNDGIAFARRLWAEQGVRVLPGANLARETIPGNPESKPGTAYVRCALVNDLETTLTALQRIRDALA